MVSNSVTVHANAAKVKIFGPATKDSSIVLNTNGSGVVIGGPDVTEANGFHINQSIFTIQLKALDEIWAIATSETEVSYLTSL